MIKKSLMLIPTLALSACGLSDIPAAAKDGTAVFLNKYIQDNQDLKMLLSFDELETYLSKNKAHIKDSLFSSVMTLYTCNDVKCSESKISSWIDTKSVGEEVQLIFRRPYENSMYETLTLKHNGTSFNYHERNKDVGLSETIITKSKAKEIFNTYLLPEHKEVFNKVLSTTLSDIIGHRTEYTTPTPTGKRDVVLSHYKTTASGELIFSNLDDPKNDKLCGVKATLKENNQYYKTWILK